MDRARRALGAGKVTQIRRKVVGAGGFSNHNTGAGGYRSVGVNPCILVFMVAAGANFGRYDQ